MAQSLAESHQAEQEAVAAHMAPQLAAAFALLDPANLEETLPKFREALAALVDYYGKASAGVALEYYRSARWHAGVTGRPRLEVAAPAKPELIDQAVEETLAPLRQATPDLQSSQEALNSAAQQLVLDQGRRQLITSVARDPQATGWARVPNPDACSFCLMLALRGVLYKTQKAASFAGHHRRANGSGGDCKCSVEPVFGDYKPPALVRKARELWKTSTVDENGHRLGGADARNAFRRAVEGRTAPSA